MPTQVMSLLWSDSAPTRTLCVEALTKGVPFWLCVPSTYQKIHSAHSMVFGVPLHVSVPDGWAYTCPLVKQPPYHTVPLNPGPVELGAKPSPSSSSLVQDP